MSAYIELQTKTNFSFLQGASHPEEMVAHAAKLGYTHIAITDINTLAGIVRPHVAAQKNNIQLIVGAELHLSCGSIAIAYPTNAEGYAQLCELLTTGNRRTEKGQCRIHKKEVCKQLWHCILVLVPPPQLNQQWQLHDKFLSDVAYYNMHSKSTLYLAATRQYREADHKYLYRLQQLSDEYNIPLVATNNVYYHDVERRQLQDVLTCIKEKCTIHTAGYLLYANAERHLKPIEEMQRLFMYNSTAINNSLIIAEACKFHLAELKYEYPEEVTQNNRTPQEQLHLLTWQGAAEIYGENIPNIVVENINKELAFIEKMNYAAYFLTVHDIVHFARSRNILCQGRGSAANSTVCFCLGITAVNPAKFDLLFERFLSEARNEPPDIDVDFEHERREEVIQYIYEKYGRERAAIVATVTQQHEKGALRDVAKAMGLSLDMIDKISSSIIRSSSKVFDVEKLTELGINIHDPFIQKTFDLINQYIGFPRQLGQHTGGFVISQHKLSKLCPVLNARMENRTCLEWNKDDIEALGFLKIDILALGMLTCIRKGFDLATKHYNKQYTLANVPQDDPLVYDMICEADTIGVFQIESRAQQSMLPRLKPRCFYDLVIEVAIVRPGPIQGDMVHPYLRRRSGKEKVEYPSKELEAILHKTLGVPLFQEQAMKVAIVAANFTPTEADQLRRSMATFKVKGFVSEFEEKLIKGMIAKGYSEDYAKRVFRQLEGFGSYGFPESHAASFALLVYVSAWMKCHYPDVFACALLNSLPMGFYQPAQIVIDAQQHGVQVRPVDINHSEWDNTLEEQHGKYKTLRLGFRHVKGLGQSEIEPVLVARHNHFTSIYQLTQLGLSDATLQKLADADAFGSMQAGRRESIWHILVKDKPMGLYQMQHNNAHNDPIPAMTAVEDVFQDYTSLSLSLKAHPISFIREKLTLLRAISCKQLANTKHGDTILLGGFVLVRQRPQTAKGVWFITLEDETGIANLICFPQISEKYKKEIVSARVLMVKGNIQREEKVIHILVHECYNITTMLTGIAAAAASTTLPKLSRADEIVSAKILPEGRNFR
jgi:error-prone DNA polymerase